MGASRPPKAIRFISAVRKSVTSYAISCWSIWRMSGDLTLFLTEDSPPPLVVTSLKSATFFQVRRKGRARPWRPALRQRARAGGRDHPCRLRHWDLVQRLPPLLGQAATNGEPWLGKHTHSILTHHTSKQRSAAFRRRTQCRRALGKTIRLGCALRLVTCMYLQKA